MNNERTLILADIHHKTDQATKIIEKVDHDKVIFVGDLFDDFNDTPEMVRNSCEWLEWFVNNPNHIMIFGNHDAQYAFPYQTFRCSGYAQWKYFIVHDNINPKLWDKLQWFYFLDNRWLLTHAGLHKLNVPPEVTKHRKNRKEFIEAITCYLQTEIRKGFNNAANENGSWVFNAGASRWGSQRVGGITWCDFQREFYPVKGINQIVGHTPNEQGNAQWCYLGPKMKTEKDKPQYRYDNGEVFFKPEDLDNPDLSFNLGLDVWKSMHYGLWDGKQLTIGKYDSL